MRQRTAVVMGGGIAGLSAALLSARRGHRVTLVERDDLALGSPAEAPNWARKGIPHFLQPHAFIPRGRGLLRDPRVGGLRVEGGKAASVVVGGGELGAARRRRSRTAHGGA